MAQATSTDIARAARILRDGGLVAFPTETVYGLGADATSSAAVQKIYIAKGRPSTNPSIVHVTGIPAARKWSSHWPDNAEKLASEFWPGPLTLVLAKNDRIASEATAGGQTVALRVPNHPLALELLAACDLPIAAPSANRSGRVSPTTALHIQDELGAKVDLILDGGPCTVGIESTVLDLSGQRPAILRPGGISRQEIEALIGPVEFGPSIATAGEAAPSPGMQAVHYSPSAPLFRYDAGHPDNLIHWLKSHPASPTILLALQGSRLPSSIGKSVIITTMPADPIEYARLLYAALHESDKPGISAIWAENPPDDPRWAAVRDRLNRASSKL